MTSSRTEVADRPAVASDEPPTPVPTETADAEHEAAELAAALRPALLRLTRLIRNQRVDMSLTLTLVAALMTLDRVGPMSATELAAHERIQPPSMTKILGKLEADGLVLRTPHSSDRRQSVLTVTDAGRELIARERGARTAWLSTRLGMLEPAELDILRRVIPVLERLATL